MILTTNGVKAATWQSINGNEFAYLVRTVQHPTELMNRSVEDIEAYKVNRAPQILLGEPNSEKRVDGIKSRNVMFIDVDDMAISYSNLAEKVAGYLSAFGLNYVIYPTIRNGIADGARLRIGVQLSRNINCSEHFKLWSWFVDKVRLQADNGGSGHTEGDFNHLQGAYVLTSQNEHNKSIIETNGHSFPIDELLPNIPEPKSSSTKVSKQSNEDVPVWAESNELFYRTLLDPENHYQEFNGWDNMLTKIGGKVYKDTWNIHFTADVVQIVNESGSSPIPNKDLEKKIISWARNWRQ